MMTRIIKHNDDDNDNDCIALNYLLTTSKRYRIMNTNIDQLTTKPEKKRGL